MNLVLQNTVEERVLEVLERKLEMFKLFMGETEQILGEVLEEDGMTFEGWIASAISSTGSIDRGVWRKFTQSLDRGRQRARQREELEGAETHRWLGTSGPVPGAGTTKPAWPQLDLSSLADQ